VWTGFIWLSIGPNDGLLETDNESSRFIKLHVLPGNFCFYTLPLSLNWEKLWQIDLALEGSLSNVRRKLRWAALRSLNSANRTTQWDFSWTDHIELTALDTIIFHWESLKDMSVHMTCRQEIKDLSVAKLFATNITIKCLKINKILNSKLEVIFSKTA
jgi:hypothetical protein